MNYSVDWSCLIAIWIWKSFLLLRCRLEWWAPKNLDSEDAHTRFIPPKSNESTSYRLKKEAKSAEITYNLMIMLKLKSKPFIRMSVITLHVNPIIIVEMTRKQYFGYKWNERRRRLDDELNEVEKKMVANSCFILVAFFRSFSRIQSNLPEPKQIARNVIVCKNEIAQVGRADTVHRDTIPISQTITPDIHLNWWWECIRHGHFWQKKKRDWFWKQRQNLVRNENKGNKSNGFCVDTDNVISIIRLRLTKITLRSCAKNHVKSLIILWYFLPKKNKFTCPLMAKNTTIV